MTHQGCLNLCGVAVHHIKQTSSAKIHHSLNEVNPELLMLVRVLILNTLKLRGYKLQIRC